jgi:Skp family chaperone for outer membrane proteins
MLALTLAIFVSAQLWAQGTSTAPQTKPATSPAPTTKVAIINLNYVGKYYYKVKTFSEEIKREAEPFVSKEKGWKEEADKLVKETQAPGATAEKRESNEKRLKELQRLAEDNKNEAQKKIGKKQEEQLKILYLDIHGVVAKIAESRGYEMVLHYNDATEQSDLLSPANLTRKMQAGALMPLHFNRSLDISYDVVMTLNGSAPKTAASR